MYVIYHSLNYGIYECFTNKLIELVVNIALEICMFYMNIKFHINELCQSVNKIGHVTTKYYLSLLFLFILYINYLI